MVFIERRPQQTCTCYQVRLILKKTGISRLSHRDEVQRKVQTVVQKDIGDVTVFVYYETIKRELNRRLIYECRCDERLKAKVMESSYGELCLL